MKTIILCGGTGTRLREETEFKPKPMVHVGNKPILWHIMKTYAHFGYRDFILALGYKSDYIKEFFLNQKAFTCDFTLSTRDHKSRFFLEDRKEVDDFNITFVDTGVDSLPGERILRCKKHVPASDRSFMVTYGDGVANLDIRKLAAFHRKQGTIGTLTGVHPASKYGLVEVNRNQRVSSFKEKPVLHDWINGGFMVFQREFFSYLRLGETEHKGLNRLVDRQELSLYRHDGFWHCMDTYKDVEDLNRMWQEGHAPWKVWS